VSLALLAWRRAVAELYAEVRAAEPSVGHARWRAGRDELFRSLPESPLPAGDLRREQGLPVALYDPAWRAVVPLSAAPPSTRRLPAGGDGDVVLERLGVLRTPWGPLDAWELQAYAGGLFVPVRDAGAGTSSYGGGRYLLDTVKGADLGSSSAGVVVDLNFLYHPSCAYDAAWTCPLAPPSNALEMFVPVGEQLPG